MKMTFFTLLDDEERIRFNVPNAPTSQIFWYMIFSFNKMKRFFFFVGKVIIHHQHSNEMDGI